MLVSAPFANAVEMEWFAERLRAPRNAQPDADPACRVSWDVLSRPQSLGTR